MSWLELGQVTEDFLVIVSPRIGLLSAWLSRNNGGVFEAVLWQASMIRKAGFVPVVIGLIDEHHKDDLKRFGDCEVIAVPVAGPGAVGFAPGLARALREGGLDLLHLHGIWMYPSRAAARWAAGSGRPYLISPHGMLDPWILARGRAKKWLARVGYEQDSWRRASRFHALTEAERDDIERVTGGLAAVIPNSVRPSAIPPMVADRAWTMAYLGRIHPKKNIAALVAAWGREREAVAHRDARLVIAGWGEVGDVADFEALIASTKDPSISFIGPLFGHAKAAMIAEARFLCLPSLSEGLPMTILEAWSAATPTLMSRACHLEEGFAAGAAIDCGTDPAMIGSALSTALAMSNEEWLAMSQRAEALAASRFAPERVAAAWQTLYDTLLNEKGNVV